MMGYYEGWGAMGQSGYLALTILVVVLVDLVLAGILLWKKINKK